VLRERPEEDRMDVERSRIRFLAGGAAFLAALASRGAARAAAPTLAAIAVYKSPTCGCCAEWVVHLQQHGFDVKTENVADLRPIKSRYGVPRALHSCHTAVVGGYVVEGHVPADLIARLLRERPAILGLAVPGMPTGSPGMEVPGAPAERYQVLTFDRTGKTGVFATR
jgi:hypothetical protein